MPFYFRMVLILLLVVFFFILGVYSGALVYFLFVALLGIFIVLYFYLSYFILVEALKDSIKYLLELEQPNYPFDLDYWECTSYEEILLDKSLYVGLRENGSLDIRRRGEALEGGEDDWSGLKDIEGGEFDLCGGYPLDFPFYLVLKHGRMFSVIDTGSFLFDRGRNSHCIGVHQYKVGIVLGRDGNYYFEAKVFKDVFCRASDLYLLVSYMRNCSAQECVYYNQEVGFKGSINGTRDRDWAMCKGSHEIFSLWLKGNGLRNFVGHYYGERDRVYIVYLTLLEKGVVGCKGKYYNKKDSRDDYTKSLSKDNKSFVITLLDLLLIMLVFFRKKL
uniref:hypothetical protein n=1 Tax=Sphaeromyxa zaharoni TaxID=275449 RepID=UPI003001F8CA